MKPNEAVRKSPRYIPPIESYSPNNSITALPNVLSDDGITIHLHTPLKIVSFNSVTDRWMGFISAAYSLEIQYTKTICLILKKANYTVRIETEIMLVDSTITCNWIKSFFMNQISVTDKIKVYILPFLYASIKIKFLLAREDNQKSLAYLYCPAYTYWTRGNVVLG
jgi:hypothetical protein